MDQWSSTATKAALQITIQTPSADQSQFNERVTWIRHIKSTAIFIASTVAMKTTFRSQRFSGTRCLMKQLARDW